MNYLILAGHTSAPRPSTVLGADYHALAPRPTPRDPDVALVLAATRAVRRGAKVHPNRIAPLRVILGEIAESVGADPALTDSVSVQMFQTGIRLLSKDKQLPEFTAMTKAIDKQDSAFGVYGPLTKKAAAKFNSVYSVTDAGVDITQGTLTMLSMMTAKSSEAYQAKLEAPANADQAAREKAAAEAVKAKAAADVKTQAATAVANKAQAVDDKVKAATTTSELKTATAETTAVATQVVATAPTSELKQEAVAAQAKAVEAQKAVEQASTPAEMEKAIVKSKAASEEVERVADKVVVEVGGGSAKQVALAVALGVAVLGLGGVIYLAATAKLAWAGAALVLTAGAAVGGYAALAAAGKGSRA